MKLIIFNCLFLMALLTTNMSSYAAALSNAGERAEVAAKNMANFIDYQLFHRVKEQFSDRVKYEVDGKVQMLTSDQVILRLESIKGYFDATKHTLKNFQFSDTKKTGQADFTEKHTKWDDKNVKRNITIHGKYFFEFEETKDRTMKIKALKIMPEKFEGDTYLWKEALKQIKS